jgi:hypothetical protein
MRGDGFTRSEESEMAIDWKELAKQIGRLSPDGWASLRLFLVPQLLQCQRFISAPPATIDHFIDKHHRVWTHPLTKIAREHIGSFVDDLFLLLLVEETLWTEVFWRQCY